VGKPTSIGKFKKSEEWTKGYHIQESGGKCVSEEVVGSKGVDRGGLLELWEGQIHRLMLKVLAMMSERQKM